MTEARESGVTEVNVSGMTEGVDRFVQRYARYESGCVRGQHSDRVYWSNVLVCAVQYTTNSPSWNDARRTELRHS
jgi:hypothetical protein